MHRCQIEPMRKYLSFLPGLITGFMGLALLTWFTLLPNPPEKLLVVFPPNIIGADLFQTISRTKSRIVGPGALPSAFILQSANPEIIDELKQAGALLVLNAENIGGCSGRKKGKLNEPV